jgi:hypothetical protein
MEKMGISEDIRKMQQEGKSDAEIAQEIQKRGLSPDEVSDSLTQAKIKEAVMAPPTENAQMTKTISIPQEQMQPSMLASPQAKAPPPQYSATGQEYALNEQTQGETNYLPQEEYSQQQYAQPEYPQQEAEPQDYSPYYSGGISSDMISEISEQVVAEKLSAMRNALEEALEFRNLAESRITYLDERLKRMEKIIDRLQLSILQKVGDYLTNVEDIKKELAETQKSFKSMLLKSSENQN